MAAKLTLCDTDPRKSIEQLPTKHAIKLQELLLSLTVGLRQYNTFLNRTWRSKIKVDANLKAFELRANRHLIFEGYEVEFYVLRAGVIILLVRLHPSQLVYYF